MSTAVKAEWQRQDRRRFAAEHGYSKMAHYATGGNRETVLERDGRQCVRCGMTEAEHLEQWPNRPITVDHIDKNRKNNDMSNLQTLCLRCHGNKDLIPRLRQPLIQVHEASIRTMRSAGQSYQAIADEVGFSIAGIFRFCKARGIQ